MEKMINEKMEEFKEGLRVQKNNVKEVEDEIYEIKKELKKLPETIKMHAKNAAPQALSAR